MKKFKIKLSDGYYVDQFFKTWVGCTPEERMARKYAKKVAEQRLANLGITDYELIEVTTEASK